MQRFGERLIGNLLVPRILAELDPVASSIRYRPGQVTAILSRIRRAPPQTEVMLAGSKGRSDFLEAARRHLGSLMDREELIVAFGKQGGASRNSRSHLTTIWRDVGSERRVSLAPQLLARLDEVVNSPESEVILVHNHPHFWLRHLAAELKLWRPTASDADRDLALLYQKKALSTWTRKGAAGRFRWYVVDEQEIREFRLPSWPRIQHLLVTIETAAHTPWEPQTNAEPQRKNRL